MKILHILGAEEDNGGILSVIRNLQEATRGAGLRHLVWVNHRYRETRRPPLEYRTSRFLIAESPRHTALALRSFLALGELAGLLRRERCDVLHAHSRGALPLAMCLAATRLRRVLFTNHSYARNKALYQFAAGLRRMHTVVLTGSMARHYRLDTQTHASVRIISACCADTFFEKPLQERRVPSADGPVRFVGLGNVQRWKNWHLLLEASRKLAPEERTRLRFDHWGAIPVDVASQSYGSELAAWATLPEVCPHKFHGPSTGIADCLRQADWFVLPSTNEPCSVALIESLALGVPAVVSASGGNVDIVQAGRSGLLFEPDSSESLAAVLQRILRGEVALASPTEIRETVRGRSASAVAAEYLDLYRELAMDVSR